MLYVYGVVSRSNEERSKDTKAIKNPWSKIHSKVNQKTRQTRPLPKYGQF